VAPSGIAQIECLTRTRILVGFLSLIGCVTGIGASALRHDELINLKVGELKVEMIGS
jgi:hypothetical protein